MVVSNKDLPACDMPPHIVVTMAPPAVESVVEGGVARGRHHPSSVFITVRIYIVCMSSQEEIVRVGGGGLNLMVIVGYIQCA